MNRQDIRLAMPSKGRLASDAVEFLAEAGLRMHKPNPRQFEASIPNLPGLSVLFQRAGDIAVSVREGSVDFGITGWDVVSERAGNDGEIIAIQRQLGFGKCTLEVIVPESWQETQEMADLPAGTPDQPLRVATKFPNLTQAYFEKHNLTPVALINSEGTLEAAPAIGYAQIIVDLVSTGTTLRDNRLKLLQDGRILESQACLVANRHALRDRPEVLEMGRLLLEYIEAHLRANANVAVFANIRGESNRAVAESIFSQQVIGGLQGPTISSVITRERQDWFAVNIIVRRDRLTEAISELRAIGGSGVVVMPVTYIFEEEPDAYRDLLIRLDESKEPENEVKE